MAADFSTSTTKNMTITMAAGELARAMKDRWYKDHDRFRRLATKAGLAGRSDGTRTLYAFADVQAIIAWIQGSPTARVGSTPGTGTGWPKLRKAGA
jgi:hypothetical protein